MSTETDYKVLEMIIGHLSSAKSYLPNRPNYLQSVYSIVYLKSGSKFEFVLGIKEETGKTIHLEFLGKKGSVTNYYGNAQVENPEFLRFLQELGIFELP